jgi:chitinase
MAKEMAKKTVQITGFDSIDLAATPKFRGLVAFWHELNNGGADGTRRYLPTLFFVNYRIL